LKHGGNLPLIANELPDTKTSAREVFVTGFVVVRQAERAVLVRKVTTGSDDDSFECVF
jgi:hypothetical protein